MNLMQTDLLKLLHFLAFVICTADIRVGIGNSTTVRCKDNERGALLKFKQDLKDEYGLLASWSSTNQDCCKWKGVQCSNQSNGIVGLVLGATTLSNTGDKPLRGKINQAILELKDLSVLDLSNNNFGTSPIPNFIGSLRKLTYLNLSFSSLSGPIPTQLANLSLLNSLDLSSNYGTSSASLAWISSLSLLEHLDLSFVNLSAAIDWQEMIGKLSLLKELSLTWCYLPNVVHLPIPSANSTLEIVNLAVNNLDSSIYNWLSNFNRSLVFIDLSYNQLQGLLPKNFENMCRLRSFFLSGNSINEDLTALLMMISGCTCESLQLLNLSSNQLTGTLPDLTRFSSLQSLLLYNNQLNQPLPENLGLPSSLTVMDLGTNSINGLLPHLTIFSQVEELYLARNQINGSIDESLGLLANLKVLDFSFNFLEGEISGAHFSNLRRLRYLDLSNNMVSFKLTPSWIPPFQLDIINLRGCTLGPGFPGWILTQNNYSVLDISGSRISDSVPSEFFLNLPTRLQYLNLSYNEMKDMIPNFTLKTLYSPVVDLNSNRFEGPIPSFSGKLASLSLSNNLFSGSLSFLCSIYGLSYLDLSHNRLSGNLPDCWRKLNRLIIIRLDNNTLSGGIPASIGSLYRLRSLHLRNNSFVGKIPMEIGELQELLVLDLGGNQFSGAVPDWIGEKLSSLMVLSLASNEFHGSIPLQLCWVTSIRILDISGNNISGNIPTCINNITAMMQVEDSESPAIEMDKLDYPYDFKGDPYGGYIDSELLVWKGKELEYVNTLGLVKSIDFSSNKLTGNIPTRITSLAALVAINLSRNYLTGPIPLKIGDLKLLDFLDLSRNRLSGKIPASLAQIDGLGLLDLAKNNLSGQIPLHAHLQNFGVSAYAGNRGLCGLPLPNACSVAGGLTVKEDESLTEEDESSLPGLSVGLGFTVGFWSFCGTLLFSSSWREAYFNTWIRLKDRFCSKSQHRPGEVKLDEDLAELPLTFYDQTYRDSSREYSSFSSRGLNPSSSY